VLGQNEFYERLEAEEEHLMKRIAVSSLRKLEISGGQKIAIEGNTFLQEFFFFEGFVS
jgi:hypothetical protein